MTDLLAANVAKLETTPNALPDTRDVSGVLQVFTDSYDAAGTAIGDTITIARLPRGARVKDVTVHHGALGASTTLRCGDAGDDDRYFAAASTATAGVKTLNQLGGVNFEVASDDGSGNDTRDVRLTVGGAAITGTIKSVVVYAFY